MQKLVTSNIKLTNNSVGTDGQIKVKMATIGEVNANGLIINSDDAIKYDDGNYMLLFDHNHDLGNAIGTFTVAGIEDNSLMANVTLSDDRAIEAVNNGSLKYASISYFINDADLNDDGDLVVNDADLVELSLVLYPADKTAQVLTTNSVDDADAEKLENLFQDFLKSFKDTLDEMKSQDGNDSDADSGSSSAADDDTSTADDGSSAASDASNTTQNSADAEALAKLKAKWGEQ